MPARTPAVAALAFGAGLCAALAATTLAHTTQPEPNAQPQPAAQAQPAGRNAAAAYNAGLDALPPEDVAWPLIVRAAKLWTDAARVAPRDPEDPEAADDSDPAWAAARRQVLDLVAEAARRPYLGVRWSDAVPADWAEAVGEQAGTPSEDPLLSALAFPPADHIEIWIEHIYYDAMKSLDVDQRDTDAFLRHVATLIALGDQGARGPTPWDAYLAQKAYGRAVAAIFFLLQYHRGALDDTELQTLASALAQANAGVPLRYSSDFAALVAAQFTGRLYDSDDPDATPGPHAWKEYSGIIRTGRGEEALATFVQSLTEHAQTCRTCRPRFQAAMERGASRTEAAGVVFTGKLRPRGEVDLARTVLAEHIRAVTYMPVSAGGLRGLAAQRQFYVSSLGLSYAPAMILLDEKLIYSIVNAEQYNMLLAGAQVSIAMYRYALAEGVYPPSLDTLVPRFLPALPVDRVSGRPFGYRLVDGAPLLYSFAVDADDDQGDAGELDRSPFPDDLAWTAARPADRPSGDFVIYPLYSQPPGDAAER